MKQRLVLAAGLLLAAAAVSGCGKSTKPAAMLGTNFGGATATDMVQASNAVGASPGLINEDQFTTSAQMPMAMGAGPTSAGRPLRWWRTIDSTARTVDFVYGDPDSLGRPTTAVATIHKHFVGTFNIIAGDTGRVGTIPQVIRKPLDDQWTRRLALRRFRSDSTARPDTSEGRFHWRVVGTSGVTVTSANATTQILSLRIQAGDRDTLITDPLQLHRLRRVLWIPHDTPVKVTVRTGRSDDIVAFYHGSGRRLFTSNGDDTYTLSFSDGDFPGMRHFGVNAFSKGTLLDDTAPYDSQAWVLPFGVREGDCEVDHR
jgi:hypothetical protein